MSEKSCSARKDVRPVELVALVCRVMWSSSQAETLGAGLAKT